MPFGDVVQTHKVSLASGEAAITFPATATSGNLLVVTVSRSAQHTAGGAWNAPAGWTAITDAGINQVATFTAAWFWKISDGTETAFNSTDTNEQGNLQMTFSEYLGPFAASPLDVSAEDVSNINTVVTSQGTGTTGTTAQADALALAFFAADQWTTVDGGGTRNYSNSFVEVVVADISSARPASIVARRVLSATGTYSCTYSVTDTGDEMYGAIAVFKQDTGGSTSKAGSETHALTDGAGMSADMGAGDGLSLAEALFEFARVLGDGAALSEAGGVQIPGLGPGARGTGRPARRADYEPDERPTSRPGRRTTYRADG